MMPKVTFKFDKEKDLWNIWETCNSSSRWHNFKKTLPSHFLEMCEGKEFSECRDKLSEYREKMYNSGLIEIFVKAVQEAWNKINDKFFKRLEKIMKHSICFENFTGYVTTVTRCPYDYEEPSFMVSFFRDIAHTLNTSGHEIMHIQFHNTYWEEIEKEIGKEKTADLKESLTVLLNLEFRDLWFVDDIGYEPHQELRKFIEEEWKKKPDFDILMKKCKKYLKQLKTKI